MMERGKGESEMEGRRKKRGRDGGRKKGEESGKGGGKKYQIISVKILGYQQ